MYVALMITARIRYPYFFPRHSRTMSFSYRGEGLGSGCQIDRQLDGRITTLFLAFQDFHTKIPRATRQLSCLGMTSRGYHPHRGCASGLLCLQLRIAPSTVVPVVYWLLKCPHSLCPGSFLGIPRYTDQNMDLANAVFFSCFFFSNSVDVESGKWFVSSLGCASSSVGMFISPGMIEPGGWTSEVP